MSRITKSILFPSMLSVALAVAVPMVIGQILPAYAQSAEDREFVTGTEDVPLMPGLTEEEDAAVVFDAPAGRIVEAAATGAMDAAAVRDFYRRSLSSLGWTTRDGKTYVRGDEALRITVSASSGAGVRVAFSLSPAASGRSSER